MALGTFTMLCNHHCYLVPELSLHSKRNFLFTPLSSHFSSSLPPQPSAVTKLLSVSMELSSWASSYKWRCIMCACPWLVLFIEHHVFKVHPCCTMYQYFILFFFYFILFYGQIIFCCMDMPYFIHSSGGHFWWAIHQVGCFCLSAMVNGTVMKNPAQVCVCLNICFQFF